MSTMDDPAETEHARDYRVRRGRYTQERMAMSPREIEARYERNRALDKVEKEAARNSRAPRGGPVTRGRPSSRSRIGYRIPVNSEPAPVIEEVVVEDVAVVEKVAVVETDIPALAKSFVSIHLDDDVKVRSETGTAMWGFKLQPCHVVSERGESESFRPYDGPSRAPRELIILIGLILNFEF